MKQISLWRLIVIPFVLIAALGGVTVYLFSRVTIANVSDNVGLHYIREVETRVYDRVYEFMQPLSHLVEINRDAISHHPEWLNNLDTLGGRFYEQAIPYSYMTFISFATADGRYINSTRDPFGISHHLATNYTDGMGDLAGYAYDPVNYVGKPIAAEPIYPNYDPTQRPFYQEAVAANGMTWSSISPYYGYDSLGVGLSAPVYDAKSGKLLGVTATSVALVALDKYLQSFDLMDGSYVFLVEKNGNLIASSHGASLYAKGDGIIERATLKSHADNVIQQAGHFLAEGSQHIEVDGQRYLYHVRPIELPYGETWCIGVLIPEAYYKSILTEYSQALIFIIAIIFISVALAGSIIARFIGRPIWQLNALVNANSLDQMRAIAPKFSYVREINSLGQGLQSMAHRLSDIMYNLEQKVAQRTSHLKDENELLLEQSTTDELTGLYNRRGFNLLSEQAHQQARQHEQVLCMVLCDIDHFKLVNDNHGHHVGDEVLEIVANVLKQHFRPTDIVARYGGEEFMLITLGMDEAEVIERLQRVSQMLKQHTMPHQGVITLSYGVACLDTSRNTGPGLEALIQEVDSKLYQAKNTGRDKIVS